MQEVPYDESDGTPRMIVKLLRQGAETEYLLSPNADGETVCDCADQTFRGDQPGHQCKHMLAIAAAYDQLANGRLLDGVRDGIRDALDESDAVEVLGLDFAAVDRLAEVADLAIRTELAAIMDARAVEALAYVNRNPVPF